MHKAVIFIVTILAVPALIFAQTDPSLVTKRRSELETQLKEYERQIAETEAHVAAKRKEANSLQREITILDGNILIKKLNIRARTLNVNKLEKQIIEKTDSIRNLEDNVARGKISLQESLRKLNEQDSRSAIELAIEYRDLAKFFDSIESLHRLQGNIQSSVVLLSDLKFKEENAKEDLERDREEEVALRSLLELEKKSLETEENSKQNLLKVTKGRESEYRKILGDKQKAAASIRSQLFLLQGSPAISFEKALEYANISSRATKVRAAFILGIIAQESELGKNIGQCNLSDDPPEYKWQSIMKPDRDRSPYLAITRELGLDPDQMPLSCPMRDSKKRRVGWGGAMGPAQFIPSTWILYKNKITDITGHKPPNPWNPLDAFVASGFLSRDNGAVGGRENERIAAAKYFAGGRWNTSLGRSYASQVLAKVDTYQEQIDLLQSLAQR